MTRRETAGEVSGFERRERKGGKDARRGGRREREGGRGGGQGDGTRAARTWPRERQSRMNQQKRQSREFRSAFHLDSGLLVEWIWASEPRRVEKGYDAMQRSVGGCGSVSSASKVVAHIWVVSMPSPWNEWLL